MHAQVRELMQRENGLRQAIAHNKLEVHYQPIICLASQEVDSLEALVRWRQPNHELLYPDQFIGLAEDMGIITNIDQWVLRQVCLQLQIWNQLGDEGWRWNQAQIIKLPSLAHAAPALSISVNLSSNHFAQKNLIDTFVSVLRDTGLSGHCLKLEVTESIFINNPLEAANLLSQLKQLNIQICLDDFGTGYSSLSYLHQFPIDIIKIDRSFIQGLEADAEKREIVHAIINLCHKLGMMITAEGIETSQQHSILLDMGCDYGQGYLFARPTDAAAITQNGMLQK